jgi:vacuolar-type H+-ATPase subunit H
MEIYVSNQDTCNSVSYIPAGEVMTEKGIEEIRRIKSKEEEVEAMIEKASKDCQEKIEEAKKTLDRETKKAEEKYKNEYAKKIARLQEEVDKKIEESRKKARKDAESISLKMTDKKAAELLFEFMKKNME